MAFYSCWALIDTKTALDKAHFNQNKIRDDSLANRISVSADSALKERIGILRALNQARPRQHAAMVSFAASFIYFVFALNELNENNVI